jgi:hypothetical protein
MAKKISTETLKKIQFYLNQLNGLKQKDIAPLVGMSEENLSFLIVKYGLKKNKGEFKLYKDK